MGILIVFVLLRVFGRNWVIKKAFMWGCGFPFFRSGNLVGAFWWTSAGRFFHFFFHSFLFLSLSPERATLVSELVPSILSCLDLVQMIVPQMIAGAGVFVHARREVMVWGNQKVEYSMIAIMYCAAEKK